MRLGFVIIASLVILCGCEPEPEIFAMKTKDLGGNVKATSYYTNGVLSSESISTRNNGIDDVWHFYLNGVLVRIDEDTNFDGVVDKSRSYDYETGGLVMLKQDTNFDGTFNVMEEYDPNKSVVTGDETPINKNKEAAQQITEEKAEVKIERKDDDFVFTDDTTVIQQPDETIVEEKETVTEEPIVQEGSSIVIEEDEYPRSSGSGSYFQPLEVDSTGGVTPARGARIIPAPVFRHPSDNLEE